MRCGVVRSMLIHRILLGWNPLGIGPFVPSTHINPPTHAPRPLTTTTDSEWLGKAPWEVPIGRVIYGMEEVIDRLYKVGEIHPFDEKGVKQGRIWEEGNEYLHREFPKVGGGLA